MICSVKPVLTENLCVVQKEDFSVCAKRTLDERPSIFIRDKPIFSPESVLHKNDYLKSSFEKKKSLVVGLKGPDPKTN
jgi:hypothetical protein